jgi:hypothetical protein
MSETLSIEDFFSFCAKFFIAAVPLVFPVKQEILWYYITNSIKYNSSILSQHESECSPVMRDSCAVCYIYLCNTKFFHLNLRL